MKVQGILAVLVIFLSRLALIASDGQVGFQNRNIPNPDGSGTHHAPIYRPDGTGAGAGYVAGLFIRTSQGLQLLCTSTFRTTNFLEFFAIPYTPVTIAGVPAGSSAEFVVRAWQTGAGSYEFSPIRGESGPLRVDRLGGTPPDGSSPLQVPSLNDFYGFTMTYAETPLVKNGNFESYLMAPGQWTIPNVADRNIPVGTQFLDGWKIESPIDYSAEWKNLDGNYSVDLAAHPGAGAISQEILTTPGSNYLLTFLLSGNPDPAFSGESPIKSVRVTTGSSSRVLSFDIASETNSFLDMKWKKISVPFLAQGDSTTLRFSSENAGSFSGAVIDGIIVAPFTPPDITIQLTVRVCWLTAEGLTYQLQRRLSLAANTWENIGSPFGGNGAEICFTDEIAPTEAAQFYRVITVD